MHGVNAFGTKSTDGMTQVRGNTENPAQFTGFMSENERVLTFGETSDLLRFRST
jgi:hypothetical protein